LGSSPIKIIFQVEIPECELESLPFYLRTPYLIDEFKLFKGKKMIIDMKKKIQKKKNDILENLIIKKFFFFFL
jgi:hypothetical protein